jgi:hypothetical protein
MSSHWLFMGNIFRKLNLVGSDLRLVRNQTAKVSPQRPHSSSALVSELRSVARWQDMGHVEVVRNRPAEKSVLVCLSIIDLD